MTENGDNGNGRVKAQRRWRELQSAADLAYYEVQLRRKARNFYAVMTVAAVVALVVSTALVWKLGLVWLLAGIPAAVTALGACAITVDCGGKVERTAIEAKRAALDATAAAEDVWPAPST